MDENLYIKPKKRWPFYTVTSLALGRDEATRTPDPYVPNVVRYQLRYIPILRVIPKNRLQRYIYFLKYVHEKG